MTAALYLTVAEVAAELQVPLRTAYTYVAKMKHLKMGRLVRVSRASFEAWKRETECESSGNESVLMEPEEGRTGQTSLAAESRRASRRSDSLARGKQASSSKEPIHVSQPRRARA